MALLEGLRDTISSDVAENDTTYRCIDCQATYDETKQLCPKCGGEEFEHV